MKKLVLILIFMTPLFLLSQTCVPGGSVSGTWGVQGSPYYVSGDIYVEEDAQLFIQKGVSVLFTGWYKLTVYGELRAAGTEEDYIWFSSANPHLKWKGISIIESNGMSALRYCLIENGKTLMSKDAMLDNCGGGLSVISSPDAKILIDNCIIQNNEAYYGGGIHVTKGKLQIRNCEITGNKAVIGGGVNLIYKADVYLFECEIKNNEAEYGGGVSIYQSSPWIESSEITNNSATENGGGLRFVVSNNYKVSKNIIANNNATIGGGITINNSDGSYCNNTITYNEASLKGGGIYVYGQSQPDIMNSILYFNKSIMIIDGEQVYIQSDGGNPSFQYCDIDGGLIGFAGPGLSNYTGTFSDNVDGDPIFENASAGNFQVCWENYPYDDLTKSACIDAGCPDIITDPDCSCCDIGATYYFQVLEIPEATAPFINHPEGCFIATWTPAYGALGYHLDVAKDPGFHKCILKNYAVTDTSCIVYPFNTGQYFYRVRAFNTGLKSDYSNVITVDIMTTLTEKISDVSELYARDGEIYINYKDDVKEAGELKVYNMAGQLITEQRINSGSNHFRPYCSNQVLVLHLVVDGKAYQDKIFLR